MAKNNDSNSKVKITKAEKARQERIEQERQLAIKKKQDNKKKLIISLVSIAVAVCIITVVAVCIKNATGSKSIYGTYTYDSQTIVLKEDMTFTATLAHDTTKSGTFSTNGTTIYFVSNSTTESGTLNNGRITIPSSWDDGHGHTGTFVKR